MPSVNIFWFRRDLRLDDNAGLYHALKSGKPVLPLFIFDTNILSKLNDRADKRVLFIYETILSIQKQLESYNSNLIVKVGEPVTIWKELLNEYDINEVFTNHDFEPYALERDAAVSELLSSKKISFKTFKDHVIFEKDEVIKDDGKPYTVFTPYSKKWRLKLNDFYAKSYPSLQYVSNFYKTEPIVIPSLEQIGFQISDTHFPAKIIPAKVVNQYTEQRNFPAIMGTSRLGIHLRFGTLSVRKLLAFALPKNQTFVNELIWRDFYQQIIWHFPHVVKGAFKKQYDHIRWENNETQFKQWCEGRTGYPLVDAGMRELNETGFMHNRVRMVVASFLCKHLLIDWRWGEVYFAEKLLDFDLAANNGGWQWAAGSGTDAAPYFRIFNPAAQLEKFDKDLMYVKKWVPEYGTSAYPQPIVVHEIARVRCLERYKEALQNIG
jgi:deoxyribodipyrimidine photo-lyase